MQAEVMDYMEIVIAEFHCRLGRGMGHDGSSLQWDFVGMPCLALCWLFCVACSMAEDVHTWWGGEK